MIFYVVFTFVSLYLGVHLSVIYLLYSNGLNIGQAIIRSFIVYLLPIFLLRIYIAAFRSRNYLIKELIDSIDAPTDVKDRAKRKLRGFKSVQIILLAIFKDIYHIKSKIELVISATLEYDRRKNRLSEKEKRKIYEDEGLWGLCIQFIQTITKYLFTDTKNHINIVQGRKYA